MLKAGTVIIVLGLLVAFALAGDAPPPAEVATTRPAEAELEDQVQELEQKLIAAMQELVNQYSRKAKAACPNPTKSLFDDYFKRHAGPPHPYDRATAYPGEVRWLGRPLCEARDNMLAALQAALLADRDGTKKIAYENAIRTWCLYELDQPSPDRRTFASPQELTDIGCLHMALQQHVVTTHLSGPSALPRLRRAHAYYKHFLKLMEAKPAVRAAVKDYLSEPKERPRAWQFDRLDMQSLWILEYVPGTYVVPLWSGRGHRVQNFLVTKAGGIEPATPTACAKLMARQLGPVSSPLPAKEFVTHVIRGFNARRTMKVLDSASDIPPKESRPVPGEVAKLIQPIRRIDKDSRGGWVFRFYTYDQSGGMIDEWVLTFQTDARQIVFKDLASKRIAEGVGDAIYYH
ncbi:MAG: hypothetical protein ACYTF6_14830 [Planctomycetota bacterium]|jgi:hypothetical protein